jgi:hypothetical protein
MKTLTPKGCFLAIACAAFTYGGLRVLLGEQLLDPAQWNTAIQITVLTVAGTIAAGHLFHDAARAKHFLSALGFAVLFVAGTCLVVYNSVGNQMTNALLTDAQAEAAAERRIAIKSELARAEGMLHEAQASLAAECKTGKGKRCEGIEATIAVYEAAVKGHSSELAGLAPLVPANAKAGTAAKYAALFGADEAKAKAATTLLVPFLQCMFFEIGSIVSLGFAFRRQAIDPRWTAQTSFDDRMLAVDNDPLPPVSMAPVKEDKVLNWCKAFKDKHGRAPTIPEVQTAFADCPKTTAWRKASAA